MGGDTITGFEVLHRRFIDPFSKYGAGSDGSPNWDPTGGTWTILSNTYRAQTTAAGQISIRQNRALTDDLIVDDQRITYTVNHVATWDVGFFFRGEQGDEANDCYLVRLGSGGIYLDKYVNGTPTTIDSYLTALSLSTDYDIEIHCKGSGNTRIQVYLEGTKRLDYIDSSSPHLTGTLGIIARGAGSSDVRFDNIDVWGIERTVHEFIVRKSIGSRIKYFSCLLDNVGGFRAGRYRFNDDIEIWRGSPTLIKIFGGFIEDVEPKTEEGQVIRLTGRDYGAQLLFVTCLETYTSTELSLILKDLLDTYAPQFTYTNVQATTISLAPSYKKRRLFMIGRELAAMAGFAIWADDSKDVHYIPEAYVDSGKTFAIGSNILNYSFPELGTRIINRITVYGAQGIAVQLDNLELQEEMGFVREELLSDPAIATEAEAKRRGKIILDMGKDPRVGQIDTVDAEDLDVGQLITVNIPTDLITGQYFTLGIDYQYPEYPPTKLIVAQYITGIAEIIATLKADSDTLMRSEMDLEATLARYITLSEQMIIQDTKLTISQKAASDSFILGHSTFGVLGSAGYGLGDRSGEWIKIVEEVNP